MHCRKAHSVESQDCVFTEDSSPESEEDEYIRYLSQIESPCVACQEKTLIKFDVWEHPEAVSNYSYYSVEGAVKIQCEFTIEHFFDDAIALKEKNQNKPQANYEQRDEFGQEKEEQYNETPNNEVYTDQYDDDE
jgi:hypothetical protein